MEGRTVSGRRLDELGNIDALPVGPDLAVADTREIQYALDQATHVARLSIKQVFQVLSFASIVVSSTEHPKRHGDRAQGTAQLMREQCHGMVGLPMISHHLFRLTPPFLPPPCVARLCLHCMPTRREAGWWDEFLFELNSGPPGRSRPLDRRAARGRRRLTNCPCSAPLKCSGRLGSAVVGIPSLGGLEDGEAGDDVARNYPGPRARGEAGCKVPVVDLARHREAVIAPREEEDAGIGRVLRGTPDCRSRDNWDCRCRCRLRRRTRCRRRWCRR